MKAQAFHRHGEESVLEATELPDPGPRAGEVIVRVRAVAMNHLDLWVRGGLPALKVAMPHVLGSDIAGVVEWSDTPGIESGMECVLAPGVSCGRCEACLSGRDHFCRSYGILGEHRAGGYAERIRVPAANVLAKPKRLSWAQAAALPLAFQTAWEMLVGRARLLSGEWILVHAAGSGVGSSAPTTWSTTRRTTSSRKRSGSRRSAASTSSSSTSERRPGRSRSSRSPRAGAS